MLEPKFLCDRGKHAQQPKPHRETRSLFGYPDETTI